MDFRITRAFEFFENDVVHLRARIDQCGWREWSGCRPSSILRAAPKKRFGRCRAFASTPPVSTLPELGTTVL